MCTGSLCSNKFLRFKKLNEKSLFSQISTSHIPQLENRPNDHFGGLVGPTGMIKGPKELMNFEVHLVGFQISQ